MAETLPSIGGDAVLLRAPAGGHGGLNTDQLKRLKELEKDNERLRRAVPDPTREKPIQILREAASGGSCAPPAAVAAARRAAAGW